MKQKKTNKPEKRPANRASVHEVVITMRELAHDHAPDGYPAVQMWQIIMLCDAVTTLTEALKQIKMMAVDHPCFSELHFDMRDIDDLATIGGDVCDWTVIAIEADNALK